jgi:hypothetical protein
MFWTKVNLRKIIVLSSLILLTPLKNPVFVQSQNGIMYINEVSSVRGSGYDVCIKDNFAFVTNNDGVDIIDVQDPRNPRKEASLEIVGGSFGLHLQDDLAYIAAGGNGLVIANISDPLNPIIVGESAGHGVARNVYVSGNYAYLACYENGLKIFDISIKSNPVKVADYLSSGRIDNVVYKGGILFLANPNLGIEVLNASNPLSLVKLSTLYAVSGVHDLSIHEDFLFAGCYDSAVWVMNITIPSDPISIANHADSDGGEAQGVIGNNTHLFVADNYGVEYKDISGLPVITEVAENREEIGAAHDIDFVDNFIFIAGGGINKDLRIFEICSEQSDNVSFAPYLSFFSVVLISIILSLGYFKKRKY